MLSRWALLGLKAHSLREPCCRLQEGRRARGDFRRRSWPHLLRHSRRPLVPSLILELKARHL
eukprot:7840553-Pyramimonas_sp.AAC.1